MRSGRLNAAVLGASAKGGTGWAIAEEAARQGMHVTVGARTMTGIAALAGEVKGKAVACDATIEDQVSAFADAAVEAAGGLLDIAVLGAGQGVMGNIDNISTEEFQRCFALNYVAPVLFVRHMARRMADGGAIVLISSISATNPWPGYFAYGCAKAATQTLVRYAALEYAPRGIRVNAIIPGPIDTPASAGLMNNPAALAVMCSEIPLARPARTQELAETVLWLAARGALVTGENIHVDGGMHLRRPPNAADLRAAFAKKS